MKKTCSMEKNMVLWRKLWNFDLRRKKHGRLRNTIFRGMKTVLSRNRQVVEYGEQSS